MSLNVNLKIFFLVLSMFFYKKKKQIQFFFIDSYKAYSSNNLTYEKSSIFENSYAF